MFELVTNNGLHQSISVEKLAILSLLLGIWAYCLPGQVVDATGRTLPHRFLTRTLVAILYVVFYCSTCSAIVEASNYLPQPSRDDAGVSWWLRPIQNDPFVFALLLIGGLNASNTFRTIQADFIRDLHGVERLDIFISYRRNDVDALAGRLYDRLKGSMPKANVFLDTEEIEPGKSFASAIEDRIRQSTVVLALIGPKWNLTSTSSDESKVDYVRHELSTAAKLDKRIIPVISNNASIPTPDSLPSDLASALRFQSAFLSSNRFSRDYEDLIEVLRKPSFRVSHSTTRIIAVFFAILLLSFLIFFFFPRPADPRIPLSPALMAQVALTTGCAILAGALVSLNSRSSARLRNSLSTSLIAGLLGAVLFVGVHSTSNLFHRLSELHRHAAATVATVPAVSSQSAVPPQVTPIAFKLSHMMPWAATPFFLAMAICWLARQTHWPRPPNVPADIWERTIDGFIVLAVMMFAQATALALHFSFETPFAGIIKDRMAESGALSPLFVIWRPNPGMLIGFLIGYLVVRDVRLAIHGHATSPKTRP